jgi:hypothetical protein
MAPVFLVYLVCLVEVSVNQTNKTNQTNLSSTSFSQLGSQRNRFDQTAGVCNAFPDNIERGPVIDRCANDRQPHCQIHAGSERDKL